MSVVVAPLECFHCGLPVPAGGRWHGPLLGETRDFCCGGCQAVAQAIAESGLDRYYRLRTANAPTARPDEGAEDRFFDRTELQDSFVHRDGGLCEASLMIEGIRCAACLWLNEERLRALPGIVEVAPNYAGQSVRVRWEASRLALSEILAAVRSIGYRARPLDPRHRAGIEAGARRRDAARLVFAGVLGMMVMNLALASYLVGGPDAGGRLPLWEAFGRWCSLVATVVLLAYPGQDFFLGAWRELRRRRAGMDAPIVLGLVTAWAGSAWATARGAGPVYFDAIAMLVFFVLLARAFETRARLAAAAALDRLAVVQPAAARRVGAGGLETEVAAADLSAGDRIRVLPGEVVPADGVLLHDAASFDEAVLTGEPWPRTRKHGEPVVAGSRPCGGPVLLRVTRAARDSTLAEIRRLLEEGLASRPRFVELADRLAARLVLLVLGISGATAGWWLVHDPARALPSTVAVLIVTCPCALALATPIALAIAAGRFAGIGVLPARLAGIEQLARADTAVFDKTGTLTLATPRLESVHPTGNLDRDAALSITAALEAGSTHPVARAIACAVESAVPAEEREDHPGEGVAGTVRGERWWVGSQDFALGSRAMPVALAEDLGLARERGRLAAVLTDRAGRAALFTFAEELRPGAETIVERLGRAGVRRAVVLSGDAPGPVGRLARSLGFAESNGAMTVEAKLAWIRAQERSSARVLFVGDGLNDAPTLAAAGVSVSFAEAPQVSRLASDFVILGRNLMALGAARRIAMRSRRILAQNLGWALGYNVLSIPLAACGLVPPWVAAVGMSASSLVVVANALRLSRPADGERLSEEGASRA